jgi:hypothetical protein
VIVIALIIIVFVEAQDPATPLALALAQAADEALGPRATVAVRAIDRGTPDQALIATGRHDGALAVARVSWGGAQRLNARVELIMLASGRATAQPLSFEPGDPLPERGRAIGLVLASLLRADADADTDSKTAPARQTADGLPPIRPAARSAAGVAAVTAEPRRWALDAAAEGGFALGSAGSGVGGTVGVRWFPFRRLGFRLGGRARFGEVGRAQAASSAFAASAGVVAPIIDPGDRGRLGLSLRADALLLYESLAHLSPDDPEPVDLGRLLPGAAALAEVRWSLSPTVALLFAAGPEVAFGETQVFVRQVKVTELAPWRLAIQGGLIAAF